MSPRIRPALAGFLSMALVLHGVAPALAAPQGQERKANAADLVCMSDAAVLDSTIVSNANQRFVGAAPNANVNPGTNTVIVPTRSIDEVMTDMVTLDIDRHQFRKLPPSSIITMAKPIRDRKQRLEHVTAASWFAVRDFVIDLRT